MKAFMRSLKALGIVLCSIMVIIASVALLSVLYSIIPRTESVFVVSVVIALLIAASLFFGYVAMVYQWLKEREGRHNEEVKQ